MKKLEPQFDFHDEPSEADNLYDENPSSKRESLTHKRTVEMVPPDGGWGWMVLLGCFISNVLGTLPSYVFSILFYPLFVSSGTSSTKISWIYNLTSAVWSLLNLFLGPLSQEFGFRKITIFGGVASFLSLFLSAFVQNPNYLFITFVVPAGISGSTSISLSWLVCSTYFKKRKGFALGISSVGSSLSTFVSFVLANYLTENYGFMGASLLLSAICLNKCVGGSLYQPVEWHMKPVQTSSNIKILLMENDREESESENNAEVYDKNLPKKSINMRTNSKHSSYNLNEHKNGAEVAKLKNTKSKSKFQRILKSTINVLKSLRFLRVHLISLCFCSLLITSFNFYMFVPFVMTNLGYTLELSAWCSSVASIGDISGRILISFLADRKFFNIKYVYMSSFCLNGLFFIVFSFARDIKALMALSCCWGISIGFIFVLSSLFIIEAMGVKMLPAVAGVSLLLNGIISPIIGPLIGLVRDRTQSYMYVLWMLGGFNLLTFCMLFLMPFAEKFDNWKYSKSYKEKKSQPY